MGKKKIPTLVDELKQKRKQTFSNDTLIIEYLFEQCVKTIRIINASGVTEFIYDVPSFVVGYPLYDISKVSLILNGKLKEQGLKTTYIPPNKIYILW